MKDLDKNYYLKKSIDLAEESKKKITLETSIVHEYSNDAELGREVRKLVYERISQADKHIKDMWNLIMERS